MKSVGDQSRKKGTTGQNIIVAGVEKK